MAWRPILLQFGLGVGPGWLTITGGFMLERLFLDNWPWWGWAIASIPGIGLIVWSIWMQLRLARPQRKGAAGTEDAPDAPLGYIGAGAIVDRYIEPAGRDADTVDQMVGVVAGMGGRRLRYNDLIADNGLDSGARA